MATACERIIKMSWNKLNWKKLYRKCPMAPEGREIQAEVPGSDTCTRHLLLLTVSEQHSTVSRSMLPVQQTRRSDIQLGNYRIHIFQTLWGPVTFSTGLWVLAGSKTGYWPPRLGTRPRGRWCGTGRGRVPPPGPRSEAARGALLADSASHYALQSGLLPGHVASQVYVTSGKSGVFYYYFFMNRLFILNHVAAVKVKLISFFIIIKNDDRVYNYCLMPGLPADHYENKKD